MTVRSSQPIDVMVMPSLKEAQSASVRTLLIVVEERKAVTEPKASKGKRAGFRHQIDSTMQAAFAPRTSARARAAQVARKAPVCRANTRVAVSNRTRTRLNVKAFRCGQDCIGERCWQATGRCLGFGTSSAIADLLFMRFQCLLA
jgi:hypothetical protein